MLCKADAICACEPSSDCTQHAFMTTCTRTCMHTHDCVHQFELSFCSLILLFLLDAAASSSKSSQVQDSGRRLGLPRDICTPIGRAEVGRKGRREGPTSATHARKASVHTHTHLYTYTTTNLCIYIPVYPCSDTSKPLCFCTPVCICTYAYLSVYLCFYLCLYVPICI